MYINFAYWALVNWKHAYDTVVEEATSEGRGRLDNGCMYKYPAAKGQLSIPQLN